MVKPLFSSFRMITAKFSSVPKFRNFTAHLPQPLLGQCFHHLVWFTGYQQIPSKVAGYVPRGSNSGELDIDATISPAEQRVLSLSSCYAIVATDEALSDAGWKPGTREERERTGQ